MTLPPAPALHPLAPASLPADEAGVLAYLLAQAPEPEALLAFALYRQAVLAFIARYQTHHARPPEPGELAGFAFGEAHPDRLAVYRSKALALLRAPDVPVSAPDLSLESAPTSMPPPPFAAAPLSLKPQDLRALITRFMLLLAAVIFTALVLRFFVTSHIP